MKIWQKFLIFLGVFCVLQILYELKFYSDLVFPAPLQVVKYLTNGFYDGFLFSSVFVTLKRLFIGYCASIIVGIPVGMLCNRFNIIDESVGKLALGLQTLPSICWVPLALIWFGQTDQAILFVVTMGSLWSLIISTNKGIQQIPPIYAKAAHTIGVRGINLWLTVMLPAALPFIISGLKQAWAFAWRSLMAAEIYVSVISGLGLGQLLHYGREMHAMDQVMGIIILIIIIGLSIETLMFAPVEQLLHKNWGTGKYVKT